MGRPEARIVPKVLLPGPGGVKREKMIRCAKSKVTVAGMDKDMNQMTRNQVLEKLRRRYETAGAEHKRKLIDQAVQLLGYHRKSV